MTDEEHDRESDTTESLPGEPSNAGVTYTGRVPETQADIELLLATRPTWWEYWLFAGTLRVQLDALEDNYRDYELGFAAPTGSVYHDRAAFDFLRTAPTQALALVKNFNPVFRPEAQSRAFGEPGEPGDAVRIMHLAGRFIDTYGAILDEAARVRGAALPEEFHDAQEAAAQFGSLAVGQVRAFVADCVRSMNGIPELTEGRLEGDDPLELTLDLQLDLDPDVSTRFVAGLKAGIASLGVDLGDE